MDDPMYKELENSIRILYGYENVYVRTHIKSNWRIPYFGPETRAENEVKEFVKFAETIMIEYPRSEVIGCIEIAGEKYYDHPCKLSIWRDDIRDINDRANRITQRKLIENIKEWKYY